MLRTALGLSLVTGKAFRIVHIRGKREKPGLLRQHLTCVRAAAQLGRAEVQGDELGSGELTFAPTTLVGGNYEFVIGSAGSTTLVLQSLLPALLKASTPTNIAIEGGTHNGLAPPFEFLERSLVPLLRKLGADISLRLVRHGFEPAGGGRMEVQVTPAPLRSLELMSRGELRSRRACVTLSSIPEDVARRELAVVRETLGFEDLTSDVVTSPGPGNALTLTLDYENVTDVFVGLGARGVAAEKVAKRACGEVRRSLRTDAPVGLHLADQLIVPMAIAGGGVFRTVELTEHTKTQLTLVPRFLDVRASVEPEVTGATFRVTVNR